MHFIKVANDFPNIHSDDKYVDAAAMFLITQPQRF